MLLKSKELSAKCYSVSFVWTQSMLSKMFPVLFCRWTNFSRSPSWNRYSVSPSFLSASRTEQRAADTVPQPDLYSGQAVYYIKKVMGLCKSTCPTFLQNFLKPSTTSKRQIRLAFGRGEVVCAKILPTPLKDSSVIQRLFSLLLSLYLLNWYCSTFPCIELVWYHHV